MHDSSSDVRPSLDAFLETHTASVREAARRACPLAFGVRPEELEQEIRIRIWKALEDETEITNPASYIRRVAVTAAIDVVRRITARREEPLRDEASGPIGVVPQTADASPEEVARGHEIRRKLKSALTRISRSRQRAVRLHLQGFTSDEIAGLLGFSEAKSRNLVYRGLDDLREELRIEGIDYETG